MLNHFFIKALHHAPHDAGLRAMVDAFWTAYQAARPAPELDARVAHLLLLLLLARVDGKSPVEYLAADRQDFIRRFVPAELAAGHPSVRAVADRWFLLLPRFSL
jgi:hypothetical protein